MEALYPDRPLLRLLFKAPTLTWRLGFGPLTGKIFLLLTTTGRKTGLPRRVMLEYYQHNGKKYAVSAFGERADWYRNLQHDPHVTIQTDSGTQSAIASPVTTAEELWQVAQVFMQHDPPLTRWYLETKEIAYTREAILANQDRLHFIRFDPQPDTAPAGQEVDLAWIWPLAFVVSVIFFLTRKRTS